MSSTVDEQPGGGGAEAPKRSSAMRKSPPPSPPPSGVDIDGVPLRDGQKIDLKQLLGHMPDIDDDDEEELTLGAAGGKDPASSAAAQLIETQFQPVDYDDLIFGEDDDEGDDATAENGDAAAASEPVQRKRRSSLRRCILHAPADHHEETSVDYPTDDPQSPDHSQKAVRFADAVGLGLADVRDLVNADEPPTIPPSALRDLHLRRRKRSKSLLTYSLDFSQPGSDPSFITRVIADKVSVSYCPSFFLTAPIRTPTQVFVIRTVFVNPFCTMITGSLCLAYVIRPPMSVWGSHNNNNNNI